MNRAESAQNLARPETFKLIDIPREIGNSLERNSCTGSMSKEIEIRLAARPGDLRRLSQTRFVKRLSQGNTATRRYNTVYYDTAKFALAKKGLSLRVRRSGRSYVQTVKEQNTSALV